MHCVEMGWDESWRMSCLMPKDCVKINSKGVHMYSYIQDYLNLQCFQNQKNVPNVCFKDKSPVVPFHGITSQYSQLKEIQIFAPIKQGTEKT